MGDCNGFSLGVVVVIVFVVVFKRSILRWNNWVVIARFVIRPVGFLRRSNVVGRNIGRYGTGQQVFDKSVENFLHFILRLLRSNCSVVVGISVG